VVVDLGLDELVRQQVQLGGVVVELQPRLGLRVDEAEGHELADGDLVALLLLRALERLHVVGRGEGRNETMPDDGIE
jgi:hypothetical protein